MNDGHQTDAGEASSRSRGVASGNETPVSRLKCVAVEICVNCAPLDSSCVLRSLDCPQKGCAGTSLGYDVTTPSLTCRHPWLAPAVKDNRYGDMSEWHVLTLCIRGEIPLEAQKMLVKLKNVEGKHAAYNYRALSYLLFLFLDLQVNVTSTHSPLSFCM